MAFHRPIAMDKEKTSALNLQVLKRLDAATVEVCLMERILRRLIRPFLQSSDLDSHTRLCYADISLRRHCCVVRAESIDRIMGKALI